MVMHLNHEKITTKKGMEVELICSTDSEALGCSFRSPAEHNYNMLRGAAYEEGRIQQKELNPNDCAMRITKIRQSDNGEWKCNVTAKNTNGEYEIVSGKIQMIVAIPPVEVSMKMDEIFITGPIFLNLEKRKHISINCTATGARPAPEFKWYIGDHLLMQNNISQSVEELEESRGTYTSTLNYFGQAKHIAQMLKCEVVHEGYQKHQLEEENNLAEAQLNLSFKPDPYANITYLGKEKSHMRVTPETVQKRHMTMEFS